MSREFESRKMKEMQKTQASKNHFRTSKKNLPVRKHNDDMNYMLMKFCSDKTDQADSRYCLMLKAIVLNTLVKTSSSRSRRVTLKPCRPVANEERGTTQTPVEARR